MIAQAAGPAVNRALAALPSAILPGGPSRLRILAYHGVHDPVSFSTHLQLILDRFRPVGLDQVLRWRDGGGLPTRAVWVTFDDGRPDVVDHAMPLLVRHGIPATMFVCPGVIDTRAPFWWDGLDASLGTALKRWPDEERRRFVAEQTRPVVEQLTSERLKSWVNAGLTVGNHTWDHPCLETCSAAEQRRQVRLAHDWLHDHVGEGATTAFAYPNGNTTAVAMDELALLGYRVGLLFDHDLATLRQDNLALSRLRIDSDASGHRAGAILSGLHSSALRMKRRLRAQR